MKARCYNTNKMKKYIYILLLTNTLLFLAVKAQYPDYKYKLNEIDGLPVSNFSIAANISQSGELFNGIAANPGKLGKWLEYRGSAILSFAYDNQKISLSDFPDISNNRQFPVSDLSYSGKPDFPINMKVKSWAPCVINDYFSTALPVIQTEISIKNVSDENLEFSLIWLMDSLFFREMDIHEEKNIFGIKSNYAAFLSDQPAKLDKVKKELAVSLSLKSKENVVLRFVIAIYDKNWIISRKFDSPHMIAEHTFNNWSYLYTKTLEFEKSLPLTEDAELNSILRWYIIPAMILTKCTREGEIVTMGYRELNQRDSYWTSWLHLVLFPDAEKKMIEESISAIKENGKIPTTILPKIERFDDLDINAFFILRFFRYVNFHNDNQFARNNWASIQSAMEWLISRDSLNDGLPQQKSYWGDWKDVPGV